MIQYCKITVSYENFEKKEEYNNLTWISSFNSCDTAEEALLELLFEFVFPLVDGKFLIRCDKGASDGPL